MGGVQTLSSPGAHWAAMRNRLVVTVGKIRKYSEGNSEFRQWCAKNRSSLVVSVAQFFEAFGFDLTDALPGQIEEFADLFEGDATAVGDIEGAGLGQFPDFESRKIEFDGTSAGIDVEV